MYQVREAEYKLKKFNKTAKDIFKAPQSWKSCSFQKLQKAWPND